MKWRATVAVTILAGLFLAGTLYAQLLPEVSDTTARYPAMRLDEEEFRQWKADHETAPQAFLSPEVAKGILEAGRAGVATSMDLFSYLQYTPSERHQGICGNCWAWASTGALEIALAVQSGIKDRLSVQFLDSCYEYPTAPTWACCGGNVRRFAEWYDYVGGAIPWSNTNASYKDKTTQCSDGKAAVACNSISLDNHYPISSIASASVPTRGVGQEQAISNIKNLLNQKKGVVFAYYVASEADWSTFDTFWDDYTESVLWDIDAVCGGSGNTFIGHLVLIVGYNDDSAEKSKKYWIVLNSWGTAGGKRPNGLFRIPMYMNYDCQININGRNEYARYFDTLQVTLPQHRLSVSKPGGGSGTVTSSPAGINCGATCSAYFNHGTDVTLTASAASGSYFTGWSGVTCPGTGQCAVTMDDQKSVSASFVLAPALTVGKSGSGTGTVTSSPPGIDCGIDCAETWAPPGGAVMTLTAVPSGDSTFTGWSGGGCSGTGQCTTTPITTATQVTATFQKKPSLTVQKGGGGGTGSVTSAPAGISCGATCTGYYGQGTQVTLTAQADPGSVFAGWSGGGCSGTGTCTLTLNSNTTVTALFYPPCTYQVKPLAKLMTAKGGTVPVTVKATGQPACASPTLASPYEWIVFQPMTSWKKNAGAVKVVVNPNTSSQQRAGGVVIGDKILTITQAGVVCAITKTSPVSASFAASGGPGSFQVFLNATDCAWSTTTAAGWISVGTTGGEGTGWVSYDVAPNLTTLAKPRTGKIDVYLTATPKKKKSFTVKQAK